MTAVMCSTAFPAIGKRMMLRKLVDRPELFDMSSMEPTMSLHASEWCQLTAVNSFLRHKNVTHAS